MRLRGRNADFLALFEFDYLKTALLVTPCILHGARITVKTGVRTPDQFSVPYP